MRQLKGHKILILGNHDAPILDNPKALHYLEGVEKIMNIRDGDKKICLCYYLSLEKKDGSIKVYDYKSDAMNGKDVAAFNKRMQDKYEGQLALYRYAIEKSFGVSAVQTELIDLYR